MGGCRRRLVASDGEEDGSPLHSPPEEAEEAKKRRKVFIYEEEEEEKVSPPPNSDDDDDDDDEEEEEDSEGAMPIGDVIRVSGRGVSRRKHYKEFELDGLSYELEDPVLLVPDEDDKKPCVAIIKDIMETTNGSIMVTGQKFYRPEETKKENGGGWPSNDARELFYSFDREEVPAESVMHKCLVHFIPQDKQVPSCRQHPGFIVQNVYDAGNKTLSKLLAVEYEDHRQREINLLVQKTEIRLALV